MPLPDATLKGTTTRPEGVFLNIAETEGAPDNGLNVFGIPFIAAGIDANRIDAASLKVTAQPITNPTSSSVTSVIAGVHPTPIEAGSFLSADRTQIALSFEQTGVDTVSVMIELRWTGAS